MNCKSGKVIAANRKSERKLSGKSSLHSKKKSSLTVELGARLLVLLGFRCNENGTAWCHLHVGPFECNASQPATECHLKDLNLYCHYRNDIEGNLIDIIKA